MFCIFPNKSVLCLSFQHEHASNVEYETVPGGVVCDTWASHCKQSEWVLFLCREEHFVFPKEFSNGFIAIWYGSVTSVLHCDIIVVLTKSTVLRIFRSFRISYVSRGLKFFSNTVCILRILGLHKFFPIVCSSSFFCVCPIIAMGRIATNKLRPFAHHHSANASSVTCSTSTQRQELPGVAEFSFAG